MWKSIVHGPCPCPCPCHGRWAFKCQRVPAVPCPRGLRWTFRAIVGWAIATSYVMPRTTSNVNGLEVFPAKRQKTWLLPQKNTLLGYSVEIPRILLYPCAFPSFVFCKTHKFKKKREIQWGSQRRKATEWGFLPLSQHL